MAAKKKNKKTATPAKKQKTKKTSKATTTTKTKTKKKKKTSTTTNPAGTSTAPTPGPEPVLPPKLGVRSLVDQKQLNAWADRRDAQAALPFLVRNLIHGVVLPAVIDFPAGESVAKHGFDGVLESPVASPWTPVGRSVWEMGVNADPEAKANKDYAARTGKQAATTGATFVFVTPRGWGGKTKWAKAKAAEGKWADVRVIDGDDLEQWLDRCKGVAVSFARAIRAPSAEARDLEGFLDEWLARTAPRLRHTVLTAGRSAEIELVRAWINGPPRALEVRAASREEALAFLAATAHCLDEMERQRLFSRALIPLTPLAWRERIAMSGPSFVCALTREPGLIDAALGAGQHVYVPLGKADASSNVDIVLGPQDSSLLEKELTDAGLEPARSRQVVREARGLLHVVVAALSRASETAPAWATPPNAPSLARLLPLRSWNQQYKGDVEVVEALTGKKRAEVIDLLAGLAATDNAPIAIERETWKWTSFTNTWRYLARHMSSSHWDAFREAAIKVLSAPDPRVEAEGTARWLADPCEYSDDLREGMAEALAIAATFEPKSELNTGSMSAETHALLAVRKTLNDASSDWKRWAALSDLLPALAEAAPGEFLSAVEERVIANPSVVQVLFRRSGLFGKSFHSGLLWALETLAWTPTYLTRVVVILAKLQSLLPGDAGSPTPLEVLRQIFVGWQPQTTASLDARLDALRAVLDAVPAVGAALCVKLLPKRTMDSTSPTHKPSFRPWAAGAQQRVLRADFLQWADGLSGVIVEHAATLPERELPHLVGAVPLLTQAHATALLAALSNRATSVSPEAKRAIWDEIREILYRNRAFADAEWAMPPGELLAIANAYATFEPADLAGRVAHLFSNNVKIANPPRVGNYTESEKAVDDERRAACRALLAGTIDDVISFAKRVEQPGVLGYAIGKELTSSSLREEVARAALSGHTPPLALFVRGLVGGSAVGGANDTGELLHKLLSDEAFSPAQRADVAAGLPFSVATWDLVKAISSALEDAYWKTVFVETTLDPVQQERIFHALLKAERPLASLQMVPHIGKDDDDDGDDDDEIGDDAGPDDDDEQRPASTAPPSFLDGPLIVTLLDAVREQVKRASDTGIVGNYTWQLSIAMKRLRNLGADRAVIARQELIWMHVLRDLDEPQALWALIAEEPKAFVELLTLAFRAEGDDADKSRTAEEVDRASGAYDLLERWDSVPGMSATAIDISLLKKWIEEVRALAASAKQTRVADEYIGRVLARIHLADPNDNIWPTTVVRKLIESIATSELKHGFVVEESNSLGVQVRSGPGGDDDRALADRYAANAAKLQSRWPTTSSLLFELAESYREAGHRNDVSALATRR